MTAQHYRAVYRQSIQSTTGQVCRVCGEWRPWDEYHRDSSYRTGRDSRCKTCRREATRAQPGGYAPYHTRAEWAAWAGQPRAAGED